MMTATINCLRVWPKNTVTMIENMATTTATTGMMIGVAAMIGTKIGITAMIGMMIGITATIGIENYRAPRRS